MSPTLGEGAAKLYVGATRAYVAIGDVIAAEVPGAPTITSTGPDLTPQGGSVFLIFDAPENDGGAPITAYRAYVDGFLVPNQGYGLDLNFNVGLGAWELELYEDGSILDENLVEISAVNAVGEGPKDSVTLNPAP